jgi:hypothetical protein
MIHMLFPADIAAVVHHILACFSIHSPPFGKTSFTNMTVCPFPRLYKDGSRFEYAVNSTDDVIK